LLGGAFEMTPVLPPWLWTSTEMKLRRTATLWRRGQRLDAVTVLSPGPKSGETKAAAIAWKIAARILADDSGRPPRAHGWRTALARAVQPLLKARGYNR